MLTIDPQQVRHINAIINRHNFEKIRDNVEATLQRETESLVHALEKARAGRQQTISKHTSSLIAAIKHLCDPQAIETFKNQTCLVEQNTIQDPEHTFDLKILQRLIDSFQNINQAVRNGRLEQH